MPRGPCHFESKGSCIYCGAIDVELSDEHIVPYALGGSHVLRKASYSRCADITKRFEQRVAWDLWGDARIAYDMPLRRKLTRPKRLVIPDERGQRFGLTIPVAEYPARFVFYKICPARFVLGLAADVDVWGAWKPVVMDDDKRRHQLLDKHSARELALRCRHVPHEFGRLLDRVGYGHMLTALDTGEFRPICVPYILGHKTNVSYVVGGTFDGQTPAPNSGYTLATAAFDGADNLILVALLRLMANTHTPSYHVVVCEVAGAGHVQRIIQKLGKIVDERVSV